MLLGRIRKLLDESENQGMDQNVIRDIKENLARLNMLNKYNSMQLDRAIKSTDNQLSCIDELQSIEPDEQDSFYNPLLFN